MLSEDNAELESKLSGSKTTADTLQKALDILSDRMEQVTEKEEKAVKGCRETEA